VLNVQVPFFFKEIIDNLNVPMPEGATLMTVAGSVLIGCMAHALSLRWIDGAARMGAFAFQELRNAVFAKVAQRSIRKVARNIFDHLLRLDYAFHLTRHTGGLSRAIDRGTKHVTY
jgi:ABC transporter ATM